DRWCELTGMSAEEAGGGGWARSIHPDDIQHVEAEWTRASAEGREFQVDCRLRQSHGGPRWVNAATIPLPGADGQPSGYLATVTDITSRKRAESRREQLLADELRARREAEEAQRRLAEQNSRLRNLDELKTQFLATASHELRTPLTSIVAFAELIRGEEDGLTPDAEGFLDIIQRNAEKLIRLVGDLLMLSRLESGVIRLELAPVSIPEVAREAVLAASAVAAEKDVALEITAGDGPLVQADGHRLAQLLDNLISNAVKFTPAGGRVTVTASHDGAAWRIDVADSGIGIPPGERDQRFHRPGGHPARHRPRPVRREDDHRSARRPRRGVQHAGQRHHVQRVPADRLMTARILVIEDDKDIALAVRTVLQRGGYEVIDAASGKAGLRSFHASRPACVLLDVGLPDLDGWTVLERVRDISEVPVLLLTAH